MATDRGVAVVTGGASGIGEAAARKLAEVGHAIALVDVNSERGEAVAAELTGSGAAARFYSCDVADAAAVEAASAAIERDLGAVDVLVTAAGLLHSSDTLLDIDLAAHNRLWQVNYNGTVHACRAFGRRMSERRSGSIVTIGSINSLAALPLPAYGPSKAAIMRLTEILSVELGRHGIRVNSVGPTYTLSPGLKAKIEAGERDVNAIKSVHALDMLVEPRHIADVIAFLCSDQAAAITGILLPVDAGYLAAVTYRTYAGGMPW